MLTTYRRHKQNCAHKQEGRKYRRCKCPIWIDGTVRGEEIRESLKTCNWEEATELARKRETDPVGASQEKDAAVIVASAATDFLADLNRRGLAQVTVRKYELLFRQMRTFATDKGLRFLKEFDLVTVREFCGTWTQGNNTTLKKLERLRAFFRYAMESKWVEDNPATRIKNPKVRQTPTMPFRQDEVIDILAACDRYLDSYGRVGQWNGKRLRALVLLLRYSGLRIGDAVSLSRDRIVRNKLFLYTAKTGTPVYIPLPEFVTTALNAVKRTNGQYFFWSGTSDKDTAAKHFSKYLAKLFKIAGITGGHAHRFRDTFAVELLLAGVPLESVSVLLGHSSIRITEKHYAPWVRARQEQLEAAVLKTLSQDVLVLSSKPNCSQTKEEIN